MAGSQSISPCALDTSEPPIADRGPLERDLVEIRNVVFRPTGGGIFSHPHPWNAFRWDQPSGAFFVVDADLRTKFPAGDVSIIRAYDTFPDLPNVVFLDDDRRAPLERIMLRIGGTKRRPWVNVMDTPNQPAGASLDLMALWTRSFWTRPGHWGGWVFQTYPIINEIEFIDAERTRAVVRVTIGYSGATVLMEKRNGGLARHRSDELLDYMRSVHRSRPGARF